MYNALDTYWKITLKLSDGHETFVPLSLNILIGFCSRDHNLFKWPCLNRHHISYPENRGLLFADKNTYVWIAQICAVNLAVPASGVHVRKGFVNLQCPHALIMNTIRGYTPLLPQWPQPDCAIRAAWQTLQIEDNSSLDTEISTLNNTNKYITSHKYFTHNKRWTLAHLCTISVEKQWFDIVRVSFQFHKFGTGAWVPYP